ncbi:cysteine desulfurase mitochondrial-like [Senna tora]|uniref:Cysteine desulfurase mitochondrial-like n=1 Tax=Senna tora TaxID=362788 RepID=A0A834T3D6_9FABA|nr:cysteine desulfurase mitochondrial-like [Senna tora]
MDGSEEVFERVQFWMQLWGTLMHCRIEKVVRKMCSLMGEVLDVWLYEDPSSGSFFMMGLISFDIKKPIRKGANLGNKNDRVFWIDFQKQKKMVESSYIPKDLGSWVRVINGGRKVAWPGEGKATQRGVVKDEERWVGMVRKNDTDALLEKLANMTVSDDALIKPKGVGTMQGCEGKKELNGERDERGGDDVKDGGVHGRGSRGE